MAETLKSGSQCEGQCCSVTQGSFFLYKKWEVCSRVANMQLRMLCGS